MTGLGRKWFEENEMLGEHAARLLYHDILTGSLKAWQFCHDDVAKGRLEEIEKKLGSILEFDSVYEIGPGNGAFYRAVQARGYEGAYYICDIPWMEKALTAGGVKAIWVSQAPKNVGLFVAHYSLSEIPQEYREILIPEEFKAAHILFQAKFADRCEPIDNNVLFEMWCESLKGTHESERTPGRRGDDLYLWRRK